MQRRWVRIGLFLVLAMATGGGYLWYQARRERRYDDLIADVARRYSVDPALVKAVVWRESRFDPGARGRAGEIGLMQIGELAAREWAEAERVPGFGHEQVADARTNLMAGSWYLSKLLRRYAGTDDPRAFGLADYNAGRSRVVQWKRGAGATNAAVFVDQIGFPGTRRYVEDILRRRDRYTNQFAPAGSIARPAPVPH